MIGETGARRILWTSLYRPRAVTLPTYRKGRIFFAGDAAHLSPIFGGRGLNLGFADAWNIAWKLGMVLAGQAGPRLLDSYSRERRQMVRKTLSDLSQAAVFMARPSKGVTLMCNAVLDLVPHEPFVRDLFDAHRAPKREGYSQTARWNDDPLPGAVEGNPLPNLPVTVAGGAEAYLNDLLPEGMVVLAFSADGRLPNGLCEWLERLRARHPIQSFVIADGTGAGDAFDRAGVVRAEMGASDGTMLLVRPDAYIAARVEDYDLEALEATLDALLSVPSCQEHQNAAHA